VAKIISKTILTHNLLIIQVSIRIFLIEISYKNYLNKIIMLIKYGLNNCLYLYIVVYKLNSLLIIRN